MGLLAACLHCNAPVFHLGDSFCCSGCRWIYNFLAQENASPSDWGLKPQALAADEFELLHSKEAQELFVAPNFRGQKQSRLSIEGYHCLGCQSALSRLPEVFKDIQNLEWNPLDSVLTIQWIERPQQPLAELAELLSRWGFRFRWMKSHESYTSLAQLRRRQDLVRIAVLGGLAGNIMMFSAAVYAGADGSWPLLFHALSAILFLPIMTYGAYPFYLSAWQSLSSRQVNLDLPLTFAFVSGSIYSYVQFWTGGTQIYFDSLAGFLFLIVVSRFLLSSAQRQSVQDHPLDIFFDRSLFQYRRALSERKGPVGDLIPGDEVLVPQGARVPVDGILIGQPVEVDTAYLTGESQTHWVLAGGIIRAGSRLPEQSSWIQVRQTGHQTDLGQIISEIRSTVFNQPLHPVISNRTSQILTLLVFSVAAVLLLYFSSTDPSEGFRRALSLMIVACPCAVAFGTPLALSQGLKMAFREGLLVRSPVSFEKLRKVRRIAFDKTGTLTTGQLVLSKNSPMIDPEFKKILLTLEAQSTHPIAQALRRSWGQVPTFKMQDYQDIPGQGPSAIIQGHQYAIRPSQNSENSSGPGLELLQDGESVLRLSFEDEVRPEALTLLQALKQKGHQLFILSGDTLARVNKVDAQLSHVMTKNFGGLTPAQKKLEIEKLEIDLYVGDGTNDVSSFQKAPISVAMPGAVLEAQISADVIFLRGGLEKLSRLFEIGQVTDRTLRRNLFFALTYNVCAGLLAVFGLITPLGAALLMPVSSILILFSSLIINWRPR